MERCQVHMVVDGEVERSIKESGNVVRTRRCKKCGTRFKTFEMTDDAVAFKQAGHDEREMELKRELEYYQGIVIQVRSIQEAEEELQVELIREYG